VRICLRCGRERLLITYMGSTVKGVLLHEPFFWRLGIPAPAATHRPLRNTGDASARYLASAVLTAEMIFVGVVTERSFTLPFKPCEAFEFSLTRTTGTPFRCP